MISKTGDNSAQALKAAYEVATAAVADGKIDRKERRELRRMDRRYNPSVMGVVLRAIFGGSHNDIRGEFVYKFRTLMKRKQYQSATIEDVNDSLRFMIGTTASMVFEARYPKNIKSAIKLADQIKAGKITHGSDGYTMQPELADEIAEALAPKIFDEPSDNLYRTILEAAEKHLGVEG